ncbi:MAG: hypothetical protein IKP82_07320 [Oscillospiraceae bacterium]|nr:hypothetical protein [Oscillospiraceae bacterium]
MKEQLSELRLEELRGFRNHPFQVKGGPEMDVLCESIAQHGILSPLLARPVEYNGPLVKTTQQKTS